jgi:chromosome partitioning protein
MKIIVVANSKGGAGKTTLATNLAVECSKAGKSVLLVDSDDQGSSMGFRGLRETPDIKAMAITKPTLDQDLKDFSFDYIVVDVGGKDTGVFRSAIMAADLLLIPTLPSQYDIWAAGDTVEVLELCRCRKDIEARIVLNRLIPNTNISSDTETALAEYADKAPVAKTKIVSRVAFSESINSGLGVSEYEPGGKAALEIQSLFKEVQAILEGENKDG